jgi:superfamily II DNA or RNA helicase
MTDEFCDRSDLDIENELCSIPEHDTENDYCEQSNINISQLSNIGNIKYYNIAYITRNGIYLDISTIDRHTLTQLCNKFVVKTHVDFGNRWSIARGFNLVKKQSPHMTLTILQLPRFGFLEFYLNALQKDATRTRNHEYADMSLIKKLGLYNLANIKNNIILHPQNPRVVSVGLKLETHQTKIIDYIMSNHYNDTYRDLGFAGINLKLKTGAGKSYIAFGLIHRLKMPSLIIVHNQPQAEDMYQLATKYFPHASVGIYHSFAKKIGDIMIVVIHSACGAEEFRFGKIVYSVNDFFSRFGFVIFDESHKYCSPEFSKVFSRCQSTYMLGLSATPGERQDGFDPITYWNVGGLVDIKEKIPNLLNDEPFTTRILGIKYFGSPEFTQHKVNPSTGIFNYDGMLTQLMEDPTRLNLIIPILEYLHDNKRNVYIFSDRLEYLSKLRMAFFDHLRRKNKVVAVDTMDDDIIEFMRRQPSHNKYVANLHNSIKNSSAYEVNKIKADVARISNKNTYDRFRTKGCDKNHWYYSTTNMDYDSYINAVLKLAELHIENIVFNHERRYQEESTLDYYNSQLEIYKKNFINEYIESKSTLSILTGGARGDQISSSSNKATMIFTTYGYMGTGKSIPKMDTVLFLTPRRTGIEQVIGRIFRPGPNKNVRWIIDIVDWRINLKSQWYGRLNVYGRQQDQNRSPKIAEIEIMHDSFDDKYVAEKLDTMFAETKIESTQTDTDKHLPSTSEDIDFSGAIANLDIEKPKEVPAKPKKTYIIRKF